MKTIVPRLWVGVGGAVLAVTAMLFAFRNDQDGQTASAPLNRLANGHYTLAVTIDGRGPFPFVLDTGAQATVVSPRTARALQLFSIPGAQVKGASGQQGSTLSIMRSYKSGLFSRRFEMVVTLPNADIVQDGVTGMNAFTGKRLEFDFQHNRATASPSAPLPAGFSAQPVAVTRGTFILVTVLVDGVRTRAVLDTGARRTFGNPALMRALGLKAGDSRLHLAMPLGGATTDKIAAMTARIHVIALGPAKFRDAAIVFGDAPVYRSLEMDDKPALTIGIDLLHTLRAIAIDYPRAELQLKV